MNNCLFDVDEEILKKSYKILKVKENVDDIKLLRSCLKLYQKYSKNNISRNYHIDNSCIVLDAYYNILAYRLNEKYVSCYKLEDKTIELSLPDITFFNDSIKGKFIKTIATDFARICSNEEESLFTSFYDGKSQYYLKTDNWYEYYYIYGDNVEEGINSKNGLPGIRPIVDLSKSGCEFNYDKDCYEVEYGEYPQMLAPDNISLELEHAYHSNNLLETVKTYTKYSDNFEFDNLKEYFYKGKKYVRFSNSQKGIYWFEVTPVKFIEFPQDKILLSKYIIMSGIPYNLYKEPKVNNFIESFRHYRTDEMLRKSLEYKCDLLSCYNKNLIFEMTHIFMFLNKYMKNDLFIRGTIPNTEEIAKVKKWVLCDN